MASSPPPKGSKRQHIRDAARHSYTRFKDLLSPSSRQSSPHPESSHPAAALSPPSALSNAPSRSTTPLSLHVDRLIDVPTPSTEASRPIDDQALSTTHTTAGSGPGPTTVDKVKEAGSVAWNGLKTALRLLEYSADVFPPLKTAVGGFLGCLDLVQEAARNRDDYEELATELRKMADSINQYVAELGSEDAGGSAAHIVLSIEAEVTHIMKQQDRDPGRRLIEANQDKEDVIKGYRRIEALFRQLQSDISLRAWKTTDKQFKMLLLERMSPTDDALYNSSYSTTIKRRGCTAETREKVQADLQDWVRDPDGAKVYWMNGMAGTGKTTIAYSLCEWLQANRQLGASFFCSRISASCRNIGQIIPTIAYQLAQYSPAFRSALCKTLEENPSAGKLNIVWQFKQLLQVPLQQVKAAIPANVVVVIDALDECEDAYGVRLVLETLLKFAVDLPLKFFVTSRPEPAVREPMVASSGHLPSVLHLHDIEQSIVEGDIKKYLSEALSSMLPPPSVDEIEQLAKHAGNLFIYAATAVRYILPDGKHVNSGARLKAMVILVPTPLDNRVGVNKKYKELDKLYSSILAVAFDSDLLEDEEFRVMELVLRTVVCAKEPMTSETLAFLLGVTEQDVMSALQPLRSVLHVSEIGGLVSTLHASFPDFMFDKTRSSGFYCDRLEHNKLLAHCCFDIMKEQLRFNICHLESSCRFDENIPDIEQRIETHISPALFYACRYWGGHLQLGGPSEKLSNKLVDLLTEGLLFWMEVLTLRQCVAMGPEVLLQAQDWLSTTNGGTDARSQLADAHAFVTRFAASACKRSTPHIYISALPFCPRSSSVYKNYWERTRGVIDLKGTAIDQREKAALVTWMTDSMIYTTAFSPDGARIASGSGDGAIRVWDARTSDLIIGPLEGHTKPVNSVSFSPDGILIASASEDCTVRVWDARVGETVVGPLQGHTSWIRSVSFSPDGTRIVSGSGDCTIRLWDPQTGENIAKPFEGHKAAVRSVAFSPDSTHIASGSDDNTILIWDAITGDILVGPVRGHTNRVWSVAFSPDGTRIVSGSADHTVRLWGASTGDTISGPFEGHTQPVIAVAFSLDGSRIVSGSDDSMIRMWDLKFGRIDSELFEGHTDVVHSVAFSPDGTRIVSGSLDQTIRVWDARPTHTASGGFQGHQNTIYSVSFTPDGTQIVSASGDHTIRMWDSRTGDPVAEPFKGHTDTVYSVAFSSDGTRIVSGSDDLTIRVWDVCTGDNFAGPFGGHTGGVNTVAFSPNGTLIASGSDDSTIRVWDARTGGPFTVTPKRHTQRVRSVAFSSDGTRIVSGSDDRTIRTWDAHTGDVVASPFVGHEKGVYSVTYSPDAALIASGSSDRTVRVWNTRTGTASAEPFRGHTDEVNSVAFSPDGTLIISGSDDCTLRLWNAHTGETIAGPFQGHADVVYSVAFSPDGNRVVSGSRDYAIRVWDVRTNDSAEERAGHGKLAHSGTSESRELASTKQSHIHSALMGTGDFACLNDGWVVTDGVPLLWIPPDFRRQLPFPNNPVVIGPQGSTSVDYRNLMLGERWTECYVSE